MYPRVLDDRIPFLVIKRGKNSQLLIMPFVFVDKWQKGARDEYRYELILTKNRAAKRH